jgi:hypothetical protein
MALQRVKASVIFLKIINVDPPWMLTLSNDEPSQKTADFFFGAEDPHVGQPAAEPFPRPLFLFSAIAHRDPIRYFPESPVLRHIHGR